MTRKMPQIKSCKVSECSYNVDMKCHAMAITVGDQRHALCDTFYMTDHKGGFMDIIGSVGACKIEGCKFNKELECMSSSGINLMPHDGHADCSTFKER